MSGEHLFSPLELRGLVLSSRLVISPMCTYSAQDGIANDWHLVHLGKFALGGAGTVFVEATAVEADGRLSAGDLGLWNDEQIEPLARIAHFLSEHGSVPAIQLGHAGRKASSQRPWIGNGALTDADREYGDHAWPTVAPSAVPVNAEWPTPAVLTEARMHAMIDTWRDAARRALAAGFRIVEVHMAHGYLLHQFLSTATNLREDQYGGSIENRMRFPLRVAAVVREVWPQDLPVFVRLSAVDEGWSLDDSVTLSQALKAIGIDVVDCSSGGLGRAEKSHRVTRGFGFQVPFAKHIRESVQIKTMAVGLILEPRLANDVIAQSDADLVAIGREALVDSNWPLHARKELLRDEPRFNPWPDQYGVWLAQRQRVIDKIHDAYS